LGAWRSDHYQIYYKEVLTILRQWVRRKRPEIWKKDSWILHHDNALAHNALSVKTFLVKHKIPVLEHPPYSPDLAPYDFFYFQRSSLHVKEPVSSP
jgi:histone-lysine N-methyltransferase SETMAR